MLLNYFGLCNFYIFQNAYRPMHSCETALVRMQVDILLSLDYKKSVILVLLGLSAAFDTVDYLLLINQLHRSGVHGNAICWLKSYLSQQTQAVKIDVISQSVGLTCAAERARTYTVYNLLSAQQI